MTDDDGPDGAQSGLPVAGWYPDPVAGMGLRWWDGARWTGHVSSGLSGSTVGGTISGTSGTASSAGPGPVGGPVAGTVGGTVAGTVADPAALTGTPGDPFGAPDPGPVQPRGVLGSVAGRWGLGDVGWTTLWTAFWVIAPAVVLGVYLVVGGATELDVSTPTGAWLVLGSLVASWFGLAGWPLVAAARKGPGWREAFGFVASRRALGVGVAGGVATFVVITVVVQLTAVVLDEDISSSAGDIALDIANVAPVFVLFLLAVAVGAPFVEELAFRGLFWGAIVKRGSSPWVATLITAVVFGAFHFEPMRFLGLTAGGVVLGVTRHYGGLGAAMLAHALVNTVGAITLALSA